jgi:hypothetical protein
MDSKTDEEELSREVDDIISWGIEDNALELKHEEEERRKQNAKLRKRVNQRTKSHQPERFFSLQTISIVKQSKRSIEKKFLLENKNLRFNLKNWAEEFYCQTMYCFLLFMALPFVSPIMKKNGLQNAGFVPSSTQLDRSFGFYLLYMFLCFSGAASLMGVILWTTQGAGGNIDLIECVICLGLIVLRLYVVAVKYAYMSRQKLLHIRSHGRETNVASDEQILQWSSANVRDTAILHQLDLAFYRCNLSMEEASTTFFSLSDEIDPLVAEDMKKFLNHEILKEEEKKKSTKVRPVVGGGLVTARRGKSTKRTTQIDLHTNREGFIDHGTAARTPLSNLKDTPKLISLRDVLYYCAVHSVRSCVPPRMAGALPFLAASVAPLSRYFINGKPPFGSMESPVEILIIVCNFVSTCTFAGSCITFAFASATLFKRRWQMMDNYFEFLIPHTDDARKLERKIGGSENLLNKIPKLQGCAKNVYLWAKGRDVVRNFASLYVKRSEHFLGAFFVVAGSAAVIQAVRIFTAHEGDVTKIKVTPGIVLAGFWILTFLAAFVYIVRVGIKANRQILYHQNAIVRHLRRWNGELEFFRLHPNHCTATLQKGERVSQAFFTLSKELGNESQTLMIRIMGFPVDKKMLSAVFTLFGSLFAAVLQLLFLKTTGKV